MLSLVLSVVVGVLFSIEYILYKDRVLVSLLVLILAISIHTSAKDGGAIPAIVALVFMIISYLYNIKVYGKK